MLNVSITTRVIKTVDVISIDNLTEIFCNIWILLKGRDDITCIWNGHADQVIVKKNVWQWETVLLVGLIPFKPSS